MKAPAFWYQPAGRVASLLTPFAKLYYFSTRLRRLVSRPYQAGVPVVCVGNVVAGGAGKTPTALALAALLQAKGQKVAFVTRGYGGTQRGPLRVDLAHHSAEDVGDEAMLLSRTAPVWIGRNRAEAIREAEKFATFIILDDGLQNPTFKAKHSILVMDGAVGIGNGHLIPAGPLREPLADALQRVSAVLVIGEISTSNTGGIPLPLAGGVRGGLVNTGTVESSSVGTSPPLIPPTSGVEIFHAQLKPAMPADFPRDEKFFAFAGIGRPEKFYDLCRKAGLNLIATEDFADHHNFSQRELDRLEQKARNHSAKMLTTEKDYVRLPAYIRARVLTFPVRLEFDDSAAIEKLIIN